MRLVQLVHPHHGRSVAVVEEPNLIVLDSFNSLLEIILESFSKEVKLKHLIENTLMKEALNYDDIYSGISEWKLLPPIDHPGNLNSLILSGTGLTHRSSAMNRNAMHDQASGTAMTDSMKMYQLGLEGGRPQIGEVGVQPEWFYKGNGSCLIPHGHALSVPPYGLDGGEEPEIAGVYMVDQHSKPWRVGFVTANEFSDHVMEKQNYLYLAPSKIRECSIGPELVINADFQDLNGSVSLFRNGDLLWSSAIKTGEKNMCHTLENLEYHHFKYPSHRLPGQIHIHFFGADAFSFGSGVKMQDADIMEIAWDGMGRPLRNSIQFDQGPEQISRIEHL